MSIQIETLLLYTKANVYSHFNKECKPQISYDFTRTANIFLKRQTKIKVDLGLQFLGISSYLESCK